MFVAAAASAAVAARGQGNLHYRHYVVNDKCIYCITLHTTNVVDYVCGVYIVYAVFSR